MVTMSIASRMIRIGLENNIEFDELYEIYRNELKYGLRNTKIVSEDIHKIIWRHVFVQNDRNILSFVNGLTDEQFSIDRYWLYREFRKTNKSDSWSATFFKLKYGDNWKEYKEKKTKINPYDITTYINRGYTVDEAICAVAELKRKTTLSIEKLGEEQFKKTCRWHKNYLEYWLAVTDGNKDQATMLWKKYTTETNRYHVNFYLKRGKSEEEAKEIISNLQQESAGVHKTYYEKLGYRPDEIDSIMQKIYAKKDSASINFIIKKFNVTDALAVAELYTKQNNLKSSSFRNCGSRVKDLPDAELRHKYYNEVHQITRMWIPFLPKCPGKSGRGTTFGDYHIDHIYSISVGYKNNISPNLIGHIVNLRWLSSRENCSKNARCDITIEELIERYNEYENNKN